MEPDHQGCLIHKFSSIKIKSNNNIEKYLWSGFQEHLHLVATGRVHDNISLSEDLHL